MWGSPRVPRACNKTKILTVVRELLTTVVALGPLRDMPHFLFINLNGTGLPRSNLSPQVGPSKFRFEPPYDHLDRRRSGDYPETGFETI